MSTGATIDFAAIEAEVNQLSQEQIKEQLVKLKARQIKATKAYYDPAKAKVQRQKKAAEMAALVKAAQAAGIYDQVLEAAKAQAASEMADDEVATHADDSE